jgi:hypothetical protein
VELVVVDSASDDETRRFLAGRPNGATVLQLTENVGFAAGCSLGVKASRGRYVLLLNPDLILEPHSVDHLIDHLDEDPSRGLVGGRVLRPDGSIDPGSCWGRPTIWSYSCSAVGLTAVFRRSSVFDPESLGSWDRSTSRDVDVVSGCLLLLTRDTWDELGGFDLDYFMYGEDADLSARAWAAGLHPSITPAAVGTHALSASSPSRLAKQRMLLRGKATYLRKRWSRSKARVGLGLLQFNIGVRAAAELVRGGDLWRSLWRERSDWSAGWPPRRAASLPVAQVRSR